MLILSIIVFGWPILDCLRLVWAAPAACRTSCPAAGSFLQQFSSRRCSNMATPKPPAIQDWAFRTAVLDSRRPAAGLSPKQLILDQPNTVYYKFS